MLAAIAAILLDSEPVGIILFVFHCGVIASLALTTSQRKDDPVVFLRHDPNSYEFLKTGRNKNSLLRGVK